MSSISVHKLFFTFVSCLLRSLCAFLFFFEAWLMYWYFLLSLLCEAFYHHSRLTMSESAARSDFIILRGTSLKAPELQQMLMCVKTLMSSLSDMSLLRKTSCTLNLIMWLMYTSLKTLMKESCLIICDLLQRRAWQMYNHQQRLHHHKLHELRYKRLSREWEEGSLETKRLFYKCGLAQV